MSHKNSHGEHIVKEWTLGVYMAADGPPPSGSHALDVVARQERDAIHEASGEDNPLLHLAFQIDFKEPRGIQRMIVGHESMKKPETNEAVEGVVADFVHWVRSQCKSRHYMLLFWGHSLGPFGLFMDRSCRTCHPQTLSVQELGSVLSKSFETFKTPIDILLFKDCFMNTWELAFQINQTASYMIGSQARVPIPGWPYADIFQRLKRHHGKGTSTGTLAVELLDAIGEFYDRAANRPIVLPDSSLAGIKDEVPYSLIDLSKVVPALRDLFKQFVGALSSAAHNVDAKAVTRRALARASRGDTALIDVALLCQQIIDEAKQATGLGAAASKLVADVRTAAASLHEATNHRHVVIGHRPGQSAYSGLSLFYMPHERGEQHNSALVPAFAQEETIREDYQRLNFNVGTGWSDIALETEPIP